jgi:hypothetical protein
MKIVQQIQFQTSNVINWNYLTHVKYTTHLNPVDIINTAIITYFIDRLLGSLAVGGGGGPLLSSSSR